MNWLVQEGLPNRTLLDLGCGAGSFTMEALKNGASSCIGIDLSPGMIRTANGLAREMGFEGRSKFELGNAAISDLPRSDIVVLDKVICCYPEADALLKNATSASQGMVGFVVPRDEGLWKWPLRLGAKIENFIDKLRKRGPAGFYIHPLRTIDTALTAAGFVRQRKSASWVWLVFLYARPDERSLQPTQSLAGH